MSREELLEILRNELGIHFEIEPLHPIGNRITAVISLGQDAISSDSVDFYAE